MVFNDQPRDIYIIYYYWRASEASETLFSHVYGNSRYIYVQVKKKAFKINAKIEDVGLNED